MPDKIPLTLGIGGPVIGSVENVREEPGRTVGDLRFHSPLSDEIAKAIIGESVAGTGIAAADPAIVAKGTP